MGGEIQFCCFYCVKHCCVTLLLEKSVDCDWLIDWFQADLKFPVHRLLSPPNNSDESVHTDTGGSFSQSENPSGHLHFSQWEATWFHSVSAKVFFFNLFLNQRRLLVISNWPLVDWSSWETSVPGEVSTREYRNSDGTFTVQSDYILVPSRETHKETLTCVTSYNEEVFTDSVTLDIQCKSGKTRKRNKNKENTDFDEIFFYFIFCANILIPDEPEVTVEGFDGNWYINRENVQLSCQADANPGVSLYQWRLWVPRHHTRWLFMRLDSLQVLILLSLLALQGQQLPA